MDIEKKLVRNLLFFDDYFIKIENGIFVIECNNCLGFKKVQIDFEEVFNDFLRLGEITYLELEKRDFLNQINKKKKLNVISSDYYYRLNNNCLSIGSYSKTLSYGFYVCDYNLVINSSKIKEELHLFISKHGVPILNNDDENQILDCIIDTNSDSKFINSKVIIDIPKIAINIDSLLYTSIIVYIYTQFTKVFRMNKKEKYLNLIRNFFGLSDNVINYDEYVKRNKNIIFSNIYSDLVKKYYIRDRNYQKTRQIETDNIILGILKYVMENDEPYFVECPRSNKKVPNLHNNVCRDCNKENKNFSYNSKRKERYNNIQYMLSIIMKLGDNEIINIIKQRKNYKENEKVHFRNSNREDERIITECFERIQNDVAKREN